MDDFSAQQKPLSNDMLTMIQKIFEPFLSENSNLALSSEAREKHVSLTSNILYYNNLS